MLLPALRSVASLLIGAGILILGNGLVGILLPIRMSIEEMAPELSGLVMSAYYAGLVLGAIWGKRFIGRVGHIRAFAAFASLICAATLVHALWYGAISWALLRALSGFCMAALFAVIESWLNERSSNQTRGQVLSLYMVTAYLASFAGQFLVNLSDVRGLELYNIAALLLCLSLVPVVLTRVSGPDLGAIKPLGLRELYKISPVGVIGCFSAGMLSGSFYGMGAIYGHAIGLSVFDISLFMGAAVLGGLLLQWPIGRASDKFDRRSVLLIVLLAAAVVFGAKYGAAFVKADSFWLTMGLPILFGGAMATIYPIAVSHAFDYVSKDRMVAASSGLLFAWAIGSTAGPTVASLLMGQFGSATLFVFLMVVAGLTAVFVRYRMSRRAALPNEAQAHFVPLPATTTIASELDPRTEPSAQEGEVLPPDAGEGKPAL